MLYGGSDILCYLIVGMSPLPPCSARLSVVHNWGDTENGAAFPHWGREGGSCHWFGGNASAGAIGRARESGNVDGMSDIPYKESKDVWLGGMPGMRDGILNILTSRAAILALQMRHFISI